MLPIVNFADDSVQGFECELLITFVMDKWRQRR